VRRVWKKTSRRQQLRIDSATHAQPVFLSRWQANTHAQQPLYAWLDWNFSPSHRRQQLTVFATC
jgi:hypothetical protein